MILGIFVVELESRKKVFRTLESMPVSQMNHYIIEFFGKYKEGDGCIEEERHKYVYHTFNMLCFCALASKKEPTEKTLRSLKHISRHSSSDVFDILLAIDAVYIGGMLFNTDILAVKSMESQDEKIYDMMMETKMQEMKNRDSRRKCTEKIEAPQKQVQKQGPVVETSNDPVLIVIKERLRLVIDKEGFIKENVVGGEVNMIIYDPEYRNVQVKVKNIRSDAKFSPYLDKNAIQQGLLRFEKERGIKKNIPMMKWSSKTKDIPLSLEYWSDEDDGKLTQVIEMKAKKSCKNVKVKFSKEGMTDIELGEKLRDLGDEIEWNVGKISKGDVVSCEIKSVCFDHDGIFPADISLVRNSVDTQMKIEDIILEDMSVKKYEVRTITETDYFKIVSE